ncbi:MAG: hypothetical protein D6759_01830 [Chloroflexi bacterium]|nr:MAG: hypothetical protein D6759_01830 [Chloroflexota bacterium]
MTRLAQVQLTCPNCHRAFTTTVEQILDQSRDPTAKARLLSGQLNVVICPACGFQGALNIPLLYHDPEKELALIFLPMEMGGSDLERQQMIGSLTNRLMSQIPPEQRKGYLLQPKTFFSMESLVKEVLAADGITQEMLEAQQKKVQLIETLRQQADDPLALAATIGEHQDLLDEEFFYLLAMTIESYEAQGYPAEDLKKVQAKLLETTPTGQQLKARRDVMETFLKNPTRESLLEGLLSTEDEATREMLIAAGRALLDYAFFQALTHRIESSEDEAEQERLLALRKQVMEIRDRVDARAQATLNAKARFLQELVNSPDPIALARRRLHEVDDTFFSVLTLNIERAQAAGDRRAVEHLTWLGNALLSLLEESAPPEVRLINRLMEAQESEWDTILEREAGLVNEELAALADRLAEGMEETNNAVAERLHAIATRVRSRAQALSR